MRRLSFREQGIAARSAKGQASSEQAKFVGALFPLIGSSLHFLASLSVCFADALAVETGWLAVDTIERAEVGRSKL